MTLGLDCRSCGIDVSVGAEKYQLTCLFDWFWLSVMISNSCIKVHWRQILKLAFQKCFSHSVHSHLYLGLTVWELCSFFVFDKMPKWSMGMKERVNHNNFGSSLLFSFSPKERNKCLKGFRFKTSPNLCYLSLHTTIPAHWLWRVSHFVMNFFLMTCALRASKNRHLGAAEILVDLVRSLGSSFLIF